MYIIHQPQIQAVLRNFVMLLVLMCGLYYRHYISFEVCLLRFCHVHFFNVGKNFMMSNVTLDPHGYNNNSFVYAFKTT